MYVCIYVYMYVCMYVYYVRMYIYVRACMQLLPLFCMYTHWFMCLVDAFASAIIDLLT